MKATEWPTKDHSIETLAKYLGFTWRDTHPSGAASVEWFDRWCRDRNPVIRQRILDYNEDDCRATRVLLDGIRGRIMHLMQFAFGMTGEDGPSLRPIFAGVDPHCH
jgi:predicted RecB family nuclease